MHPYVARVAFVEQKVGSILIGGSIWIEILNTHFSEIKNVLPICEFELEFVHLLICRSGESLSVTCKNLVYTALSENCTHTNQWLMREKGSIYFFTLLHSPSIGKVYPAIVLRGVIPTRNSPLSLSGESSYITTSSFLHP